MQGGQLFGCKRALKTDIFLLKYESPFLTDFDEITTKIYLQDYILMHFFTKFFTIHVASPS